MNTQNQESALEKFLTAITEAQILAREITEAVENHLDADPENVTWGDVANANRVLEDLRNIAEYLIPGREGESK
jgi:hypothetical protein